MQYVYLLSYTCFPHLSSLLDPDLLRMPLQATVNKDSKYVFNTWQLSHMSNYKLHFSIESLNMFCDRTSKFNIVHRSVSISSACHILYTNLLVFPFHFFKFCFHLYLLLFHLHQFLILSLKFFFLTRNLKQRLHLQSLAQGITEKQAMLSMLLKTLYFSDTHTHKDLPLWTLSTTASVLASNRQHNFAAELSMHSAVVAF